MGLEIVKPNIGLVGRNAYAASVTDLHLREDTTGRLTDFCEKVEALPAEEQPEIISFGGDIFDIGPHWQEFRADPNGDARKRLIDSQVKMAQEHFLPAVLRLTENNPKVQILVTYGNGDYDGYHYLDTVAQVFNSQYPNLHCIDGKIFQYGRFSFLGLGGAVIDPANKSFAAILEAGYPGFTTEAALWERFQTIVSQRTAEGPIDLTRLVFIPHVPALGHLDYRCYDEPGKQPPHEGSTTILAIADKYDPLILLTGHVHGAPIRDQQFISGKKYAIRKEMTRSVMNGSTVAINPGGDYLHNGGTQAALINIGKLDRYRREKLTITDKRADRVIKQLK